MSSFFKECEVDTKLTEFGLEDIEERKLVIEERKQSPLLWGISLKLVLSLTDSGTNQNPRIPQSLAVVNIWLPFQMYLVSFKCFSLCFRSITVLNWCLWNTRGARGGLKRVPRRYKIYLTSTIHPQNICLYYLYVNMYLYTI